MAKKHVDGLQGETSKLKSDGGDGKGNEEGLINQELIPQLDSRYQKPQGREDRHASNYDNDTPSNWLRGMPNESAEGKPGFDHTKKG
jgi:hypothetical protein